MAKLDFITPFYNEKHNQNTFVKKLDSLLASEDVDVRAIPFGSLHNPVALFDGYDHGSRNVRLLKTGTGVSLFELTYLYKENDKDRKAKGRFFVYEHPQYPSVYAAVTLEDSSFYLRGLLPFIQGQYPKIIQTFITHKKLRRLLEEFKTSNGFSELTIVRASQRFRIRETDERQKIVPVVSWPDMDLKEAFDWVYQNNGWFRSVKFEVKTPLSASASISLTRQGAVRMNHHCEKVFAGFVHPVFKTLHENIQIFGHRSRRDNVNLTAKPLTIDFGIEQFADVEENKRFVQAMQLMGTASTSVIHGNPYIHLTVIDYYDGSTFDLWVLSAHQLIIVPQMKGSIAAIKRLINHIYDTYAEGDIKDYEVAV